MRGGGKKLITLVLMISKCKCSLLIMWLHECSKLSCQAIFCGIASSIIMMWRLDINYESVALT